VLAWTNRLETMFFTSPCPESETRLPNDLFNEPSTEDLYHWTQLDARKKIEGCKSRFCGKAVATYEELAMMSG
jgi:hypothetical protein